MSREIDIIASTSIKVSFFPWCNFNCDYCGGNKGRKDSPYPAAMEDYRATKLDEGKTLTDDELITCLAQLAQVGFKSIRPTGGEPTLNPQWDTLIERAGKLGLSADITTNASRLNDYLDRNGKLPEGLSMVKVSLDTQDPEEYRRINGNKGNLHDVEKAIHRVLNLGAYVRLNSVLTRDHSDPNSIKKLINYAESLGVQQVQLLDLVYYPNYPTTDQNRLASNKKYWEDQFVSFNEYKNNFAKVFPGTDFQQTNGQFGVNFWKTTLPSGLVVTFKDSTVTMRDKQCYECPVFCQEGRCLVRLGSDGNLTPCPDYRAELPDHFNVLESIEDQTFPEKIGKIIDTLVNSKRVNTINEFTRRHGLNSPPKSYL